MGTQVKGLMKLTLLEASLVGLLRQSGLSVEQREQCPQGHVPPSTFPCYSSLQGNTCMQVMGLMELTSLKGSLVGLPGHSGLSVEQRKRLTIGVELVANPSIVFMVRLPGAFSYSQRCQFLCGISGIQGVLIEL